MQARATAWVVMWCCCMACTRVPPGCAAVLRPRRGWSAAAQLRQGRRGGGGAAAECLHVRSRRAHASPLRVSLARRQIFQAWLLLLAEQPEADWPLPEPLLALGQRTWIAATKRIT